MKLSYTSIAGINQAIKIISGPGILFLMGNSLGNEELAVMMVFISISASTQLFDGGMAFVMKHFISHEAIKEYTSKRVKNYYIFSKICYGFISSIAILLLALIGGVIFKKAVNIDWVGPWILLIMGIFSTLWIAPEIILNEGMQNQKKVYESKLISSISYILAFIIGILNDKALFAVGSALLISSLIQYWTLKKSTEKIIAKSSIRYNFKSIYLITKSVYREVKSFLLKIMITWVLGYFFWNSWNLIVFQKLSYAEAAKIAFSFTLLKACFSFSDSLIQSKAFYISHLIAGEEKNLAKKELNKITIISILLYLMLALLIISAKLIFNQNLAMNKIVSGYSFILIFMFYLMLIIIISQATYCRAFKEEPYFFNSIFSNLVVPVIFYLLIGENINEALISINVVMLLSLVWSSLIYRKYILIP